jgi:hypothetical protein
LVPLPSSLGDISRGQVKSVGVQTMKMGSDQSTQTGLLIPSTLDVIDLVRADVQLKSWEEALGYVRLVLAIAHSSF